MNKLSYRHALPGKLSQWKGGKIPRGLNPSWILKKVIIGY